MNTMVNETEITNLPHVMGATTVEGISSLRAGVLAARIEEGAATLAEFVQDLSDAEWNLPLSPRDGRTIGLVVHHVATMYPIEIAVAQTIAGGISIIDVTWEAVAELNAKHALDHEGVTKAEALDLLLRNSNEAASAVRALTDDELDRSAPFSLSYGAPMSAQFVIEDHALRHSWHHLAGIRKTVGR